MADGEFPKADGDRKPLPDGMIYGHFARIFSNMDGKKNLQRLIRETEWESGTVLSPSQIKKYITAISYLSDWGYLKMEKDIDCSEIL